jgi:hypothetical protein
MTDQAPEPDGGDGWLHAMMGDPPWQAELHVKGADGSTRAVHHGPTWSGWDDTVTIKFRIPDWQPIIALDSALAAVQGNHPSRLTGGPVGGTAASGMGGGGAGSSDPVNSGPVGAGGGSTATPSFQDYERELALALRALTAVAHAAGLRTEAMQAHGITEMGAIIAARVSELRRG